MDETPAERGLKTNGTPVVATATENKIALSGSAEPEAPIFRMVSLPPSRLFSAAAEEPAAALNEAIVAHKSISREQRLLVSIADLPGVFAAAVITSESFEKSENFPTDLDAEVFRKTLRGLCEAARYFATPLGGSRGLTLQCAHFYVSIAEQEGAWICALHRERTLSPAAHAALATAELD
jgi:hypothetical protein